MLIFRLILLLGVLILSFYILMWCIAAAPLYTQCLEHLAMEGDILPLASLMIVAHAHY